MKINQEYWDRTKQLVRPNQKPQFIVSEDEISFTDRYSIIHSGKTVDECLSKAEAKAIEKKEITTFLDSVRAHVIEKKSESFLHLQNKERPVWVTFEDEKAILHLVKPKKDDSLQYFGSIDNPVYHPRIIEDFLCFDVIVANDLRHHMKVYLSDIIYKYPFLLPEHLIENYSL